MQKKLECNKYYCEFHTCASNSCILEDYGHIIASPYGHRFKSFAEACEEGTAWFKELKKSMETT